MSASTRKSARALGAIIDWDPADPLSSTEFHNGMLDYFDWWFEIDPLVSKFHDRLSPPAFAFGHDLVNMATYAHEILNWLSRSKRNPETAVMVSRAMTEAFFFSVRSACDAVASALAYVASDKLGQAPDSSLRRLIEWAGKNEKRVHPEILAILKADFEWFWELRTLRDQIAHGFVDIGTFYDGHQFDMTVMSTREKRKADRYPLLPLLARQLHGLTDLGDRAARTVNGIVGFPSARHRSRVLSGLFIPALHKLIKVAPQYAKPPY
jgi:hypothetical protein